MVETGQDRSVIILYGTETGTSQDLAEEIGRCLERLHFHTDIFGLDLVNYAQLKDYTFAVFVVATTGQGDFPDNARKFWTSLLRKKLSSTTLTGVDYALVGLGDSSYPKFNSAARKLDKRLRQLGALELLESCEADEQGDEGTDGAFLAWLQGFRESILKTFPLSNGQEPIPNDVLLSSKFSLRTAIENDGPQANDSGTNGHHIVVENGAVETSEWFPVMLKINERVTPSDHWQDVRFMSLQSNKRIEYLPGDAIAISPRNMPKDVENLIDRMEWHDVADMPIRLASTRAYGTTKPSLLTTTPLFSRSNLTLRVLLTEHLDINAIPRRSFFGCIANYTQDEMHKERLLEFTDPRYLDEYYDYAPRPRRSILEILQEFDSVILPWEEVNNIFPPMRPRQFSIASGGALKPDNDSTTFELLIAIVKYRTLIRRIREGVCTRYLAQLPAGTTLQVSLKIEGRFSKSLDLSHQNHILIGAGTGIAPLRAIIHEKLSHAPHFGKTVLFFGCRNKESDYFFQDESTAICEKYPDALEVIPAFSRDQKAKVYVQDLIRQKADLICEFLLDKKATIVVCGSSGQMPKAVRQALVDALTDQAGKWRQRRAASGGRASEFEDVEDDAEEEISTQEDAEKYLARLEKENRYKQETWS